MSRKRRRRARGAASSANCRQNSTLRGLAASRARYAAAGSTRASNAAAILAYAKVDRSEMATTVLAVRFTTSAASGPIAVHGLAVFRGLRFGALRQILADDRAHERRRRHRAYLEKAHLLFCQSHLRDRIVNDDTQLGVELNLEGIGAHDVHTR